MKFDNSESARRRRPIIERLVEASSQPRFVCSRRSCRANGRSQNNKRGGWRGPPFRITVHVRDVAGRCGSTPVIVRSGKVGNTVNESYSQTDSGKACHENRYRANSNRPCTDMPHHISLLDANSVSTVQKSAGIGISQTTSLGESGRDCCGTFLSSL
jgi:hypothetical protein